MGNNQVFNKIYLISVIWYRATQMVNATYGTGRQQSCTRSGRRTMGYALMYCGIHMSLLDLLLLAGTARSSIGIKMFLTSRKPQLNNLVNNRDILYICK